MQVGPIRGLAVHGMTPAAAVLGAGKDPRKLSRAPALAWEPANLRTVGLGPGRPHSCQGSPAEEEGEANARMMGARVRACRSRGAAMAARGIQRPPSLKVAFASKVLTAAIVFSMSILQVLRRDIVPICSLGVIAANVVTKALKLAVRRALPPAVWMRPAGSHRDSSCDPGFPSSHTSNLAFLSFHFAWYFRMHCGWAMPAAVVLTVLPPVVMAAARIWDKDHTIAQTVGGLVCGWALGAAWVAAINAWVGESLKHGEPQPWSMVALCYVVGLPMFIRPLLKKSRPAALR